MGGFFRIGFPAGGRERAFRALLPFSSFSSAVCVRLASWAALEILGGRGKINFIAIAVVVFLFFNGDISFKVTIIGLRTRRRAVEVAVIGLRTGCRATALSWRSRAPGDRIGFTLRVGNYVDIG